MRTLEIKKNDANQRLDKFLQKRFKTLPKSLMYKYIRKKCIKVNGKKCDIQTMLKEGDVLTFYIKDEFFEASEQKSYEFMKAPKTFDIVYEDENLILIDKKPGIIVHPDKNYHFDSLVARVQHYLYDKGEYNPDEEKAFAPALANRIDRNTGGIVIAAKNAESLRMLNAKMKTRELEKYYLCLLYGKPKRDSDTLHGYMKRWCVIRKRLTLFRMKHLINRLTNWDGLPKILPQWAVCTWIGQPTILSNPSGIGSGNCWNCSFNRQPL